MQQAAGVSAVVFGLAGMGGAAVQASMNSGDAAVDVSLYSFCLNGVRYAGCTQHATFRNGDDVEVAFSPKADGNEVLAVRRHATRSIWLYPYMSRGTLAAASHRRKVWLLASLASSSACTAVFGVFLALTGFNWGVFVIGALGSLLLMLVTLGVIGFFLSAKFTPFAQAAYEVFAVLGYSDPRRVDIDETSKTYRKVNGIPWTWENRAELWY